MFQFTFVDGKHTVMKMEHFVERNEVFKSAEEFIGREMWEVCFVMCLSTDSWEQVKHGTQCTYDVTLRSVRVSIVAVEKQ